MKKWMFNEASSPTIVTKIADLIGLNLIFILSCLPIVTIGPSLCALYSVTLKMADPEKDYYVVKDYIKSFKINLKQGSILFGIQLLIATLILGTILLINLNGEPTFLVTAIFLVFVTIFILVSLYIYPLAASFENKTASIFKNAIIMCFHQMAKSIILFLIAAVIIVLPLISIQTLFIWVWLVFSLTAYLQSLILLRIFKSYIEAKK